ncbi:hypothetical protein Chor_016385 [Crotalus horridus]
MAVATCLAVLALLSKVESPSLRNSCDPKEFPYSGICCKLCPAGTHVEEYCSSPHTQGICKHCIDGENYTEYDNGLLKCLPCEECKPEQCVNIVHVGKLGNSVSGYKMITPCTRKKNTECQCNDGYFCPQGCEECMKCKKRSFRFLIYMDVHRYWCFIWNCVLRWDLIYMEKMQASKEERSVIPGNENVNSATEAPAASEDRLSEAAERENLEMGNREQDSVLPDRPSVSSLHEVACSNGQSSGRNDVRRSNKPAVRIKGSPVKTLEDIYFQIKDMLGSNYWKQLMRKCGLLDNDIQNIILDNAQNVDEQHYQLLKTLRDRNGVVAAFQKIFAGLEEMNLNGIYENLLNELKSKDLVIMEAEA